VELFGDPTGPPWGPGGLPAAQIEALQVADTVTDATVGTISAAVTTVDYRVDDAELNTIFLPLSFDKVK
jgi:hypothetical protein